MSFELKPILVATAVCLAAAACEDFDRPNRPLPEGFQVTTLDGEVLDSHALHGTPWVINLWVPG